MRMALLVVVAIKKEKNEKGKVVELEKKNEEKDKFY